jgi:hypothetical protein
MPRNLSPNFIAQLGSTGMSAPIRFVVITFANLTLYLSDGIGTITPAGPAYSPLSTFPYGQAFTGLGWLGKVSTVPQTTKVQAQNVTFSLTPIVPEFVTEIVNQVRITCTVTVWLGYLDSDGNVIPDPVQLFSGALDVPSMTDSGDASTLSITAENPLVRLNEAPSRMFDDADQQIYYPGDLGFSFVDALGNLTLFWPSPYISGSPYPISMAVIPNGADIPVGGTVQLYAQINYSDGSYKKMPGSTGSGIDFDLCISSTNPAVAEIDSSLIATGISPGKCSMMARVTYPLPLGVDGGATPPGGQYRAASALIVHS